MRHRFLARVGAAALAAAAAAAVVVAAAVAPSITFEDITASSGVRFTSDSSPTELKHQPETMVAGVALVDYDGDGQLDIYFVNGGTMPGLDKRGERYYNRLYHNNGNLTFTDVTMTAGVAGAGYGMAVAAGDYDNDGRPDLFVANLNGNQLFHNNGDGTFSDVTARAGVRGALYHGRLMWSTSAAWLDYDRDGKLDLFVSNYCEWDPDTEPPCVINGHRVSCNPRLYKPLPNTLYHNNGDGTFTDVSAQTGIAAHLGRGMGVAVADYDGDGWPDIFVANDDAPNQLFHSIGGKRFEEVAGEAGVALAEGGNVISGMGAEFRDLFNTGRVDLWVTAIEKQTFPLFRNMGGGQFAERTAMSGLGLATAEMSGWSNAVDDFDNDGWKDLFVARSNVIDNVALFAPRAYAEPLSIFRNLGNGRFANVSATAGPAFATAYPHRGAAHGDFDNDGRVDLVVTVLNGPARLLRNTSSGANHWIAIRLRGTRSNRMGLDAKLKLTAADGSVQYNHATTSTGFASSSDPRVHFGLGANTKIRALDIAWPSGIVQRLHDLDVDRTLEVTETEQ